MSLTELLIRIICTILVLLIMARLSGPKQISQMNFYDYVVGIAVGSLAASVSIDKSVKIQNGLISIILYLLSGLLMSWLARKNMALRRFLSGKPIILISRGSIQWKGLKRARMNLNELQSNLRYSGYFDLSEIDYAIMEPTGKVSVLPKGFARPPKSRDLGLSVSDSKLCANVMIDGIVLAGNLEGFGKDMEWLKNELEKQGIHDLKEVALAALDREGGLTVWKKDNSPAGRNLFL